MENSCLIALIEKFRKKDMSVFPVIFSEFESLIHHYALKCEAEDLAEELSVLLLELMYRVDVTRFENVMGDGLHRYIAVCLRNKYIACSKAESEFKKSRIFVDVRDTFSEDSHIKGLLKEALGTLTPKQITVLRLKYSEDYSDFEIAEILGISRQAVNRIKIRGVERLREYFNG